MFPSRPLSHAIRSMKSGSSFHLDPFILKTGIVEFFFLFSSHNNTIKIKMMRLNRNCAPVNSSSLFFTKFHDNSIYSFAFAYWPCLLQKVDGYCFFFFNAVFEVMFQSVFVSSTVLPGRWLNFFLKKRCNFPLAVLEPSFCSGSDLEPELRRRKSSRAPFPIRLSALSKNTSVELQGLRFARRSKRNNSRTLTLAGRRR